MMRKWVLISTCVLGVVGTQPHAHARDFYLQSGQNARQAMALGDYAPIGIAVPEAGGVLFPSIAVEGAWDNNIYRTPDNAQSDYITSIQPELRFTSDWNRHQLQLSAKGDVGYYADNTSENYQDYGIRADARVDVLTATYLNALFSHERLHEDRGSPNDVRGNEPTVVNRSTASVGFVRELGRLKLYTDAAAEKWRFHENFASGGVIRNDDRDHMQQYYGAKLAYELKPGYDAFVRYTYNIRQFDELSPNKSDSTGHDLVTGAAFSLTGTLEGEVYVGSYWQDYDSSFDSLNFVNYGGALIWGLSPVTSLRADVLREVRPTNIINASDYIETGYALTLSHALRYNALADIRVRYVEDEFLGLSGGTARNDDFIVAGMGMEYLFNRNVSLRGSYDYMDRSSTVQSGNFDNSLFSVSLKLGY